MERVWNEIREQRQKPPYDFVYPARTYADRAHLYRDEAARLRKNGQIVYARSHELNADALERSDNSAETTAEFRQDAAAAKIFRSAFDCAAYPPRLLYGADLKAIADELSTVGSYLFSIARRIDGLNLNDMGEGVTHAAKMCEGYAERLLRDPTDPNRPSIRGDPIFLERRSKETVGVRNADENDLVRFFVRSVAPLMTWHFGAVLYGTVASLANVALNRDDVFAREVKRMETGR
jgi:hypothetical protein